MPHSPPSRLHSLLERAPAGGERLMACSSGPVPHGEWIIVSPLRYERGSSKPIPHSSPRIPARERDVGCPSTAFPVASAKQRAGNAPCRGQRASFPGAGNSFPAGNVIDGQGMPLAERGMRREVRRRSVGGRFWMLLDLSSQDSRSILEVLLLVIDAVPSQQLHELLLE